MRTTTEDRRLDVLRAIVQDYVSTREPVGSRMLVERHSLGVSPATIRNDMAALEEEGYIAQPHTSAGRVPTDKGYRLFVDRLASVKPLSTAERRAIQSLLDGAIDTDDVVERTVRLLAQLTRQVAVVQYPSQSRATVRHVELVPTGGDRLLVVVITDTGRVAQRTVELAAEAEPEVVAQLRVHLNVATAGRRRTDAVAALATLTTTLAPGLASTAGAVVPVVVEALEAEREDRIVMAGAANLVRADIDLGASVGPVLEALEEQVVLMRLLTEMSEDGAGLVSVRIGAENAHAGLASTSVIASGYGAGSDVLANLAVVGPTRMDYPTTISAVRAVARYVSRILAG